jgi:thiol-disulfide isomerase/thioredoxin
MSKFFRGNAAAFVFCGGLLVVQSALADGRPAEKILADIKSKELATAPPANINSQAAYQAFIDQQKKIAEQRAELIGELLKSHPDAPELPGLILDRWQFIMIPGPKADALTAEVESVLATSKNEKLVAEAAFLKAAIGFEKLGPDADSATLMKIAEGFIKKAPKDPRGALFLGAIASKTTDEAKLAELNKRIEKDYPDSPNAKQLVNERRVKEAVGKPFALEFTDAIKGTAITMASLKGKVVVIDFWATWCGPCVNEMPKMKELYAKYKSKGVEFIGVSLDQPKEQGGLDKLKAFVAKNGIEWPQYYQGNFWQSEFSSSWHINSIPCVFLVDADGNLASVKARGQLDKLIPEYLEKAKANSKKVASAR